MTEEEWFTEAWPNPMVRHLFKLGYLATDRRFSFFALSCARAAWPALVDERSRHAVDVAERYLVGLAIEVEFDRAKEDSQLVRDATLHLQKSGTESETKDSNGYPTAYAAAMAAWVAWRAVVGEYHLDMLAKVRDSLAMSGAYYPDWTQIRPLVLGLSHVVRDIFGNPFRPGAVDAAWLTSTVVQLARGIYEDRAFDRMPILADALQDAGCDNDDVLSHCRDESATHVRGCWVVDLLLGKT